MNDKITDYHLSETELIMISAYFLALPLPPLLSERSEQSEPEFKSALKEAVSSLEQKGWITAATPDQDNGLVIASLAENLRDIAYGNQMLHFYLHQSGTDSRQLTFIHHEARFVRHELLNDAQHEIGSAENMGRQLLDSLLENVGEGEPEKMAQLPLEAWHYLLTSRELGIENEVLQEIASSTERSGEDNAKTRLAFIQDVLSAPSVFVITAVYDRLAQQQEKAAFVLAGDANWLVTEMPSMNGKQVMVHAQTLSGQSLLQAVAAVYGAVDAAIMAESEMG